ncbi:uncharacterized protein [Acropora muricata]|uniref:uncharacterized protein n=1 Tax=Acropora muricata TaxID=159855 RepID=UPI0034E5BF08
MADFLLQLPPVQQRRPRNYRFNATLLNYTDEELRARYRFGRESIQYITNLIETDLRRKTKRSHALRPIDQVLIALRFYASGNFLQVIGDTVGVDKSTVSRAVHDVSQLLSAKQNTFIKWPTTAAVINENKNGFYRRRRFSGIIGFIDGTQIRIIAPSNNESVNRKGFHSINVQGSVTTKLLLLEVSYDCDPDETSKDCFEFKFWDTWRYSNAPINCTSKAVIDDSVEIICYEIVYNFGTAAGASYGVFKISNGAMELLATLILMRKTTRFVSVVRTVLLLAVLGFVGIIIGVQGSSWRVYLETTNFTYIYQALGTLSLAFQFVFLVPWKDLIRKINEERSTRGQEHRLDYIVIE